MASSLRVLATVAALFGLLGCTATATSGPSPSTTVSITSDAARSTPAATSSTPVPTSAGPSPTSATVRRSTVTRTAPGRTIVAGPPPSTREPAPVPSDCPYLDADTVSAITGQRHGQTETVAVSPFPICRFVRSDGGWLATVRIVLAVTPEEAVAAVDQHVPVADSQPAHQPAGWAGGSKAVGSKVAGAADSHAWYAVSRNRYAVIAEENENPSIKARSIAVCAIFGARLQSGPAPDYCASG